MLESTVLFIIVGLKVAIKAPMGVSLFQFLGFDLKNSVICLIVLFLNVSFLNIFELVLLFGRSM